jgi:hypothetical protein
MVRPRWHDALIISAIVAFLAVGVVVLWWGDVKNLLGIHSETGSAEGPTPITPNRI